MDIWGAIAADFQSWLSGILASFQRPSPPPPRYVAPFAYATNAGQDWGGQSATYQTDAALLTTPIGYALNSMADAAFINQYARPTDWIVTTAAPASNITALAACTKGIRVLAVHNGTDLTGALATAIANGFQVVGANYEASGNCATLEPIYNNPGGAGFVQQCAAASPPQKLLWTPTGVAFENCIASNPDWITACYATEYQAQKNQPAPGTPNPVGAFLALTTPTLAAARAAGTNVLVCQMDVAPKANPGASFTEVAAISDALMTLPPATKPDVVFIFNDGLANHTQLAQALWRRYRANG